MHSWTMYRLDPRLATAQASPRPRLSSPLGSVRRGR
jgi:hypothetical protein